MLGSSETTHVEQASELLKLRIQTFHRDGHWYAECLDLALLARRPSEMGALRALFEQIQDYVQMAAESGAWGNFVPRRSPASHFVRYYLDVAVYGLLHRLIPEQSVHSYRMPVDRRGHCLCA